MSMTPLYENVEENVQIMRGLLQNISQIKGFVDKIHSVTFFHIYALKKSQVCSFDQVSLTL